MPPLLRAICVHGAGGGGWEWGVWMRVLGAHRIAALAPDLHAGAGGLAKTHFADYRAQVINWCRDSTSMGSPLVLVGASLGGLLALSAAAEAEVAAMVLINPVPPAGVTAKPIGTPYAQVVPWGRDRSIISTRRAMPDADDATCLYAFRRWRDESGVVLEESRLGIAVMQPDCPMLILASEHDDSVPPMISRALAIRCGADHERLDGCSHLGPLLGLRAAEIAERAARWLLRRTAASSPPNQERATQPAIP